MSSLMWNLHATTASRPSVRKSWRTRILMFLRIAALTLFTFAFAASAEDPWTPEDVIAPPTFAAVVSGPGEKPPVYYVGFNVLYRSKHIPGAVYAGPGAKLDGIELLKQALKRVPHDREIVLYCGCCPINQCPNLRPAFQTARDLGFKKVRVLMLPTSFATDWVGKGYPVE